MHIYTSNMHHPTTLHYHCFGPRHIGVIVDIIAHIKRHKVAYSFGAGVVVAGITCVIVRGRIEALALRGAYRPETADILVNNRPFFSFFSGQNSTIIRNEIGRPSYLIHDLTTDLYYRSQSAAAKALGVSPSTMSKSYTWFVFARFWSSVGKNSSNFLYIN